MRQTVAQYIAAIKRIYPDIETQGQYWTYPQARDSHLLLWPRNAPSEFCKLPASNHMIAIGVDNTDRPGVLIRMVSDAPKPREIAQRLERIANAIVQEREANNESLM